MHRKFGTTVAVHDPQGQAFSSKTIAYIANHSQTPGVKLLTQMRKWVQTDSNTKSYPKATGNLKVVSVCFICFQHDLSLPTCNLVISSSDSLKSVLASEVGFAACGMKLLPWARTFWGSERSRVLNQLHSVTSFYITILFWTLCRHMSSSTMNATTIGCLFVEVWWKKVAFNFDFQITHDG